MCKNSRKYTIMDKACVYKISLMFHEMMWNDWNIDPTHDVVRTLDKCDFTNLQNTRLTRAHNWKIRTFYPYFLEEKIEPRE